MSYSTVGDRPDMVCELAAVCECHDASCYYVPGDGIWVTLRWTPGVRWHWSHAARAASVRLYHPSDGSGWETSPERTGEALIAMGRLLCSQSFRDALDVTLARVAPDAERALRVYRARVDAERSAKPSNWTGD